MMFNRRSLQTGKRGFTLIELAIVLAVTSLLTAGLWRMMSSGNTQLRDQSTADQHRDLIKAVRGYLASAEGQVKINKNNKFLLPIGPCPLPDDNETKSFCSFLPEEFKSGNAKNSYGQGYEIGVWPVADASGKVTSYSFMIQTTGGDTIPDTSGGRISSMIGNDGGFVYSIAACAKPACGAFGTWVADPAEYVLTAKNIGHVATRTFVGASAELEQPWLARMRKDVPDSDGDKVGDLNTFNNDVETAVNGSTFYGGLKTTVGYAGKLIDFFRVTIGGNDLAEIDAPLTVTSSLKADGNACTKDTPSAGGCPNALDVVGDASVSGLLSANKLFAAQFIYREDSDIRLKKDIEPISNPLEKMGRIKGYSFVMEREKSKRYGVVAQEVEKVFPELVSETSGYKGVDYIGLIGPLVAAVNDLKKENDVLREQVEEQAKSIEMLKVRDKK